MKKASKMLATGLLSASLMTGCGGADNEIGKCETGWKTPEVDQPYEVLGILSNIGEKALTGEYEIYGTEAGVRGRDVIVSTFTDIKSFGGRNNADELSELFCLDANEQVTLSPHGVTLVSVAINGGVKEADRLVEYLPYMDDTSVQG